MIRKTTPERLSFFSDAIFAVFITVLVLELRPPEGPTFEALLERWPTWLSYAVSYLFIAIVRGKGVKSKFFDTSTQAKPVSQELKLEIPRSFGSSLRSLIVRFADRSPPRVNTPTIKL